MKLKSPLVLALGVLLLGGTFIGFVALNSQVAHAGEALEIGTAFPDWTLTDSEGSEHSKADTKGKIVAYVFTSLDCPFSRGADPTIDALAKKYKDQGVVFLGVDSHKSTTPEELQKHREERGISYPILKDTGSAVAKAVGAKVTPEMFITDAKGNLQYHGPPDNRKSPEGDPSEHYADAALAALVKGDEVKTKEVSAWGCGIKFAL